MGTHRHYQDSISLPPHSQSLDVRHTYVTYLDSPRPQSLPHTTPSWEPRSLHHLTSKHSPSLTSTPQDGQSRWLQSYQPSNYQPIASSWGISTHTTLGGRDRFRNLLVSPLQATQSRIGLKTTISVSRTSRQYPHTTPGMADSRLPSIYASPEVHQRTPSCHSPWTMRLPLTTARLSSPFPCHPPHHQPFHVGVGIRLTGKHSIPRFDLRRWISRNSKVRTTL